MNKKNKAPAAQRFTQRTSKPLTMPVPKVTGPMVIGKRTCIEVLRAKPERVRKVYVIGSKTENQELVFLADKYGLPTEQLEKDQLDQLAKSSSHQGCLLVLKDRNPGDLKEFIKRSDKDEKSLVLALDQVQDPHNLGAILRAAECFGVQAVIWSKDRSVGITPTVTKTSVGASELLETIEVVNLRDALLRLKIAGYWIVATAKTESAVKINDFDWPAKAVVVLGGEGEGIGNLILKESDFQVWVPLSGAIESLNVSQAAAVMLFSAGGR